MDLAQGWTQYQRSLSRQESDKKFTCPACSQELPLNLNPDQYRDHVKRDPKGHQSFQNDEQAFSEALQKLKESQEASITTKGPQNARQARKRSSPGIGNRLDTVRQAGAEPESIEDESPRGAKKIRSPSVSEVQERGSSPPTIGHSQPGHSDSADPQPGPRIFAERRSGDPAEQISKKRSSRRGHKQERLFSPLQHSPNTSSSEMLKQPDTRPISQEQLVTEVKGIYAGLVMVESKCIEVDTANQDPKRVLTADQWQALIALHRTLLHEHHDFFLASQHPSANPALRNLAFKYAMPARMWRHGIHSFLELLRRKLPDSLEHMLNFIYLAYSIMALLYETVPSFSETWIECLGDLGRYRMAIEDEDVRDREIWAGVSRYWYSKASDTQPHIGRLYHHLAILARPNVLQQLFLYDKSLCVLTPFPNTRESIMTLFDPLLHSEKIQQTDAKFVRIHGSFFSGKKTEQLDAWITEYHPLLDGSVARLSKRWIEIGYHMGISLACLLLNFGSDSSRLRRAITSSSEADDMQVDDNAAAQRVPELFDKALDFTIKTYEIVIRRWGDSNTLAFTHTFLVFLYYLSRHAPAMSHVERTFPWKLTATMLNYQLQSSKIEFNHDIDTFPHKEQSARPLPEDFALRSLSYVEEYFPSKWHDNPKIDGEERYFEVPSMIDERKERILYLGRRIADSGTWLTWNDKGRSFGVASKYDNPHPESSQGAMPAGIEV